VCTDDLFDYIGPSYNPPSDDEDFEDDKSSDDEGSVDTDDLNAFGNRLYDNARITQQESTVLIFSYICRHNLTKAAQNDLLKLLLQYLPKDVPDNTIPRSVYLLRKSLNIDFSKSEKFYFCPNCKGTISFDTDPRPRSLYMQKKIYNQTLTFSKILFPRCVHCNTYSTKNALEKGDNYFFILDLRTVLRFVLQIPTNAEEILKVCSERNNDVESDVYRDVTDGLNYKSLGNHVAFQHSFILSFFHSFFLSFMSFAQVSKV